MPRTLLPREREQFDKLVPIIQRMDGERAYKLHEVFESLESVADAMSTLSREIDDSESLEDTDRVQLTEGLEMADAIILREWLKKKADAIQAVYEVIPLGESDLFNNLSTTAIDVYYDAQQAKEDAENAQESANGL